MSQSFSTRRGLLISGGLLIAAATIGLYIKFFGGSQEREFSLIKPWFEPDAGGEKLSEGFLWIHRQCRDNLADLDADGELSKRGASEISRVNPRTWKFKLPLDTKWSDDGSVVTADDYEKAWTARSKHIKAPEFTRIKKISTEKNTSKDVLNNNVLIVELDGSENHVQDLAALSSPWLTALKIKDPASWSWAQETSGPCDGAFVPKQKKGEFVLTRNRYWREFKPELISVIKVTLENKNAPSQVELFRKGMLSFVGPETDNSSQRVVYGRAFLEPKAYYIILNPRGAFGGSLAAFPHFAINRGELAAVAESTQRFYMMSRILPLSLLSRDSAGNVVRLPSVNLESVMDARHTLGVKDDSTPIDKITPPFKHKLRIVAPEDPAIDPVVERFGARLKANYNINSDVTTLKNPNNLPGEWDVLFVAVDIKDGVPGWSRELARVVAQSAPSRQDLVSKILAVGKDKNDLRLTQKSMAAAFDVDAMAPQQTILIPLGQFGYEVLVEDGVIDVAISGQGRRDPDVSRARRLITQPPQGKKS